jgi:hypothetical protein
MAFIRCCFDIDILPSFFVVGLCVLLSLSASSYIGWSPLLDIGGVSETSSLTLPNMRGYQGRPKGLQNKAKEGKIRRGQSQSKARPNKANAKQCNGSFFGGRLKGCLGAAK